MMASSPGQCASILHLNHRIQTSPSCQSVVSRSTTMTGSRPPGIKFSIESILGLCPSGHQDSPKQGRRPYEDSNGSEEPGHDDEGDDDMDEDEEEDDDEDDDISVDDTRSEVNADNKNSLAGATVEATGGEESIRYPWLQCTRYHPPKLQRSKKKEGQKKWKLGRNPRIPFTQHQLVVLEDKFRRTHYLSSMDVSELSSALSLTETRVKIWFQNRRARERRDKGGVQTQQPMAMTKPFQPLTVPTVTWSVPTTSNYIHYQQPLDFRSRFLMSSLSLYAGTDVHAGEDCTRDIKLST